MIQAILFDLDETLVAQEVAFNAAFRAVGRRLADRGSIDPESAAAAAAHAAEEALARAPFGDCVRRCRFGGRDVLWGEAGGHGACEAAIAQGAAVFRADVWRTLAARFRIRHDTLGDVLQAAFLRTMKTELRIFPEVPDVLRRLRAGRRLVVVTNGMEAAQRAKLRLLGIDAHFHAVVASAAVGVGKPAPEMFRRALDAAGTGAARCVMVGDSVAGDIEGAEALGIRSFLIRQGGDSSGARLSDLPSLVAALSERVAR